MHADICNVNMSLGYLGVRRFDKTYMSFPEVLF